MAGRMALVARRMRVEKRILRSRLEMSFECVCLCFGVGKSMSSLGTKKRKRFGLYLFSETELV